MKILVEVVFGITVALLCIDVISRAGQNETAKRKPAQPQRDYPVKPVPFTAVHITDLFWAPRIEINRTVSIPFAFKKCEETGRIENFNRAAAALKGELKDKELPPYPFDDTDLYKVIEGAAYTLSVHPDPKLEAYVDGGSSLKGQGADSGSKGNRQRRGGPRDKASSSCRYHLSLLYVSS